MLFKIVHKSLYCEGHSCQEVSALRLMRENFENKRNPKFVQFGL